MTKLTGLFERSPALFSGRYEEYVTPKNLLDELNKEFHFVLDPCTSTENPLKRPFYFTKEDDGLSKSWTIKKKATNVFVNPPYHSKNIIKWIEKAVFESKQGSTVVMLLPSRTDTLWFHKYIYRKRNVEIRFLKGRLKFDGKYGKNTAPFPSMVIIFRNSRSRT